MIRKLFLIFNKKQKRQLLLIGVLLFIGILFEMLGLGILIPALTIILNPNLIKENTSFEYILNFLGNPSSNLIVFYSLGILVFVYTCKVIYLSFLSFKQSSFSSKLVAEISFSLFKCYLLQPYKFHLNKNSSDLINNIQTEASQFTSISQAFIFIVLEITIIIGSFTILVIANPLGAITVCFLLLFSSYLFNKLTKNKILNLGVLRQDLGIDLNKNLIQGLNAVKDIKIFGVESFFLEKFKKPTFSRAQALSKLTTLQQFPRLYLEFIAVISLVMLIGINVFQQKPLDSLLPTIGVFIAASFRMLPSVNRILSSMQGIKSAKPVIDLLYEEFKLIKNQELHENFKSNVFFKNNIELRNIGMIYENNEVPALNKINIKICKGETIGIFGKSGSGKSTLVDIMLGLLKPTSGLVLVDNCNISNNKHQWQNLIGYVPQTIFLLDDSIKNNIAFGIPNNKISHDALNKAIDDAQIRELINELPNGLDTVVGERGVRLSGGQRQRIGIARALYKNPEILVLDEGTSALDYTTENNIMKSINAFKHNKTIIIIAHRLSTLENCDSLYEINKGNLIKH